MHDDRIENIARYLSLAFASIRARRFWLGGEWCRAARPHAALLPAGERARALLLIEITGELGQAEEARSQVQRVATKRGSCRACGARKVRLFEVSRFGFYADWVCKPCAAEMEQGE